MLVVCDYWGATFSNSSRTVHLCVATPDATAGVLDCLAPIVVSAIAGVFVSHLI